MDGFELLEALNPVPEPRGNPGPMTIESETSRRWPPVILAVAAASVLIVGGAFLLRDGSDTAIELDIADEPTEEVVDPDPGPVDNEADDAIETAIGDDDDADDEADIAAVGDPAAAAESLAQYRQSIAISVRCYNEIGISPVGPWPSADGRAYRYIFAQISGQSIDIPTAVDRCGPYTRAAEALFQQAAQSNSAAREAMHAEHELFVSCLASTDVPGLEPPEQAEDLLALSAAELAEIDQSLVFRMQVNVAADTACFAIDADGTDWLRPLVDIAVAPVIAQVEIPTIGVDVPLVDGLEALTTDEGVAGRFLSSAWPGQPGNTVVFGHRSDWGRPFAGLDELTAGDAITVTNAQGEFVYVVESSTIRSLADVEHYADVGDNRLTLITNHPEFSAQEQLTVVAKLQGLPARSLPPTERTAQAELGSFTPGAPDISKAALASSDNNPYLSFEGTDDLQESADAFLATVFVESGSVSATLQEEVDGAASLRWFDSRSGAEGWLVMQLIAGRYRVLDLTTDGFQVEMHQAGNGPAGYVLTDQVVTIAMYALADDGGGDEESLGDTTIDPRDVGFRLDRQYFNMLPTSEVRVELRNADGEQVGAAISTLEEGPGLERIRVVLSVEQANQLSTELAEYGLLIFDGDGLDRWQSTDWLFSADAPAGLDLPLPDGAPEYSITTLTLTEPTRETEYRLKREMLQTLREVTTAQVPATDLTAGGSGAQGVAIQSSYRVESVPAVATCHGVVGVATRPVQFVTSNPDSGPDEVFATAAEAIEASGWLDDFDSAEDELNIVEFVDAEGAALGYAASPGDRPFTFLRAAHVVDWGDGWTVSGWDQSAC